MPQFLLDMRPPGQRLQTSKRRLPFGLDASEFIQHFDQKSLDSTDFVAKLKKLEKLNSSLQVVFPLLQDARKDRQRGLVKHPGASTDRPWLPSDVQSVIDAMNIDDTNNKAAVAQSIPKRKTRTPAQRDPSSSKRARTDNAHETGTPSGSNPEQDTEGIFQTDESGPSYHEATNILHHNLPNPNRGITQDSNDWNVGSHDDTHDASFQSQQSSPSPAHFLPEASPTSFQSPRSAVTRPAPKTMAPQSPAKPPSPATTDDGDPDKTMVDDEIIISNAPIREKISIETLRPGEQVHSSVIDEVLRLFHPDPSTVHVLSCLYVDTSHPQRNLSKRFFMPPQTSLLVVPLHHSTLEPNHWTVAIVDLDTKHVKHYDPLGMTSLQKNTGDALLNLLHAQSSKDSWKLSHSAVSELLGNKQEGSVDCGVYVIAHAVCAMLDRASPHSLHVPAWRRFLAALLDPAEFQPHHPLPILDYPQANMSDLTFGQICALSQSLTPTVAMREETGLQVQLVQAVLDHHKDLNVKSAALDAKLVPFQHAESFRDLPFYQKMTECWSSLMIEKTHVASAKDTTVLHAPRLRSLQQHLEATITALELYERQARLMVQDVKRAAALLE